MSLEIVSTVLYCIGCVLIGYGVASYFGDFIRLNQKEKEE